MFAIRGKFTKTYEIVYYHGIHQWSTITKHETQEEAEELRKVLNALERLEPNATKNLRETIKSLQSNRRPPGPTDSSESSH